ncbi:MAG: hypothetical protein AAGI88_17300, partial [Pseudomonadota bacterium]
WMIGSRLPIIQGVSFSFLAAFFAIIASVNSDDKPQLNENFDHDVLKLLSHGEMKNFSNYACEEEITQLAGNGANEIRAWIVMAAALKHHSAKTLCYSAMPEWLTGMAVAVIEPPSREAEAA